MRILVGVKRVIDYAVKVRVAADKKGAWPWPSIDRPSDRLMWLG